MRQERASQVPALVVTGACVLVSVALAAGVHTTDSRFASLLAVALREGVPHSLLAWDGLLRSAPSLVASALIVWIGYELWRLARRGPGSAALLLAFAARAVSLAVPLVVALLLQFVPAATLSTNVQRGILLSWVLAPGALGLVASALLALGLLRSRLVAAWVAWIALAATVLAVVASALTVSAIWGALFAPSGLFLDAIQQLAVVGASSGWVSDLSTGLFAFFWVALGLALYVRATEQE